MVPSGAIESSCVMTFRFNGSCSGTHFAKQVSIHVEARASQSYLYNEPCVLQRTLKIVGHIGNHVAPFRPIRFSC